MLRGLNRRWPPPGDIRRRVSAHFGSGDGSGLSVSSLPESCVHRWQQAGGRATKTLLTAEEFGNYPFEEDKRYELDEGELIVTERPAYWHNHVLANLTFELSKCLEEKPIGEALISENVYALSANTRRSPDVAVILGDRYEELKDMTVISIIPEIAAEVLLPSESTRMVHRKLRQYFQAGVKEVWLVDTESEEVEVWTASLPQRTVGLGESLTTKLLAGFEVPLSQLFG